MDGSLLASTEMSQSIDFDVFKFATLNYKQKLNNTYKEFKNDYSRLRSINLLFRRYAKGDDLNFRLVLNHVVVLGNVFEHDSIATLIFSSVEKEYWSEVKTVLLFLNLLPVIVPILDINTLDININETILRELNSI